MSALVFNNSHELVHMGRLALLILAQIGDGALPLISIRDDISVTKLCTSVIAKFDLISRAVKFSNGSKTKAMFFLLVPRH